MLSPRLTNHGEAPRPQPSTEGTLPMLFTWDTVRLFLHIVAATIWVGGQLTLAALVPTLRALGSEAPGAVARRRRENWSVR